jgi:class III poly(R)-hydroxyalkanoic acid synthase PhaE subunit
VTTSSGVTSVYDFWLGLLPLFFARLGAAQSGSEAAATPAAPAPPLPFPVDQVAKAAAMTQQALHGLAETYGPMLQAAGPQGLLGQWTTALPYLASMQQMPGLNVAALPLQQMQQMQQAWFDAGTQLLAAQDHATTFERTFGALSDALGFGPVRKLHAAAQELMQAGVEQNQARARYALLVQGAFAAGLDAMLERLAGMAKSGERVDSIFALMRLWAVSTEEAVHEVLQSAEGLEATAAIARASLAYRRRLQHVATILADALDMATRRDLDEAFREIQALKRELRALQPAMPARERAAPRARKTRRKSTS